MAVREGLVLALGLGLAVIGAVAFVASAELDDPAPIAVSPDSNLGAERVIATIPDAGAAEFEINCFFKGSEILAIEKEKVMSSGSSGA